MTNYFGISSTPCWIFTAWFLAGLLMIGPGWSQTDSKKVKIYQCKKCDACAKAVPPERPAPAACPKSGKCNFQPYVRSSTCSPCW